MTLLSRCLTAMAIVFAIPATALAWPVVPSATHAELCTGVRNIGVVTPGDACPVAPPHEWDTSRLFGTGPLPPSLEVFCLYEWRGQGPPTRGTLPDYGGTPGTDWTDPDCLAVSAQSCSITVPWHASSQVAAALGNGHHALFSAQVDDVPGLLTPAGNVTVAVIDSQVPGGFANNPHGAGMMGIIENRSCDHLSGPCPITTTPYLGLDTLAGETAPNTVEGGDYGFIGALAPLIRQAHLESADPRLIINLSLGWSAEFHGSKNWMRLGEANHARAVRRALKYVRCNGVAGGSHGALVIAAAGNTSGGSSAGGPLYPAAWEQLGTSCSAGTEPLVTAIGGVDGADEAISNARSGAMPSLVAPAHEGIALSPSGGVIRGGFTGTSVATAVGSGAAALLWALAPSLSPSQVLAELRAAAVPLGDPADFCLGGACPNMARLSVCQAAAAVSGASLACATPLPYSGTRTTWSAVELADVTACLASATGGTESFAPAASLVFVPPSPPCTEGVWRDPSAGPLVDWACPQQQLSTRVAGGVIDPQPGGELCAHCMMDIQTGAIDSLIMPISSMANSTVYPKTLNFSEAGTVVHRVDVSSFPTTGGGGGRLSDGIAPGRTVKVDWHVPRFDFDRITLDFVSASGGTRVVGVSDVEF